MLGSDEWCSVALAGVAASAVSGSAAAAAKSAIFLPIISGPSWSRTPFRPSGGRLMTSSLAGTTTAAVPPMTPRVLSSEQCGRSGRRRMESPRLVAGNGLPVRERGAGHPHVVKVHRGRVQRQLEPAGAVLGPDHRVRGLAAPPVQLLAAGTDDDLGDTRAAESTGTGLGREPLVVVIVPGQDELGACGDERVEEGLHGSVAAVVPGREPGLVQDGHRARVLVGGEVLLQPRELGATGADVPLGVEGDHAPGTDVLGVVTLRPQAGRGAEVVEVAVRPCGVVLVVARNGAGDRSKPAVARLVGPLELRQAPR